MKDKELHDIWQESMGKYGITINPFSDDFTVEDKQEKKKENEKTDSIDDSYLTNQDAVPIKAKFALLNWDDKIIKKFDNFSLQEIEIFFQTLYKLQSIQNNDLKIIDDELVAKVIIHSEILLTVSPQFTDLINRCYDISNEYPEQKRKEIAWERVKQHRYNNSIKEKLNKDSLYKKWKLLQGDRK